MKFDCLLGTKRSKIKTVKNTESSAQEKKEKSAQKRKIMNMKNEWMNDDNL